MQGIEINDYILNYMDNDMTSLAVMLTGEWGSGKTYYIKNELIPHLNNNNKKYCVVSLYGSKSIDDIAKAIFFELYFKKINKKRSLKKESGKIFGKTILRTSLHLLGAEFNEGDMKNFYKSVDLTDTLVILEDLERSGIDIVEVLGYVNNMLENDGIKVLFVANEDSILNKPLLSPNPIIREIEKIKNKGEETVVNDEESITIENKYKKIKEKTIGDTLIFTQDYDVSVKEIIKKYEKIEGGELLKTLNISEISELVRDYCYGNLRTFIYATQKTVELFKTFSFEQQQDISFIRNTYYSNIIFAGNCKAKGFPEWNERIFNYSSDLGNSKYPLFRFAYNYFKWNQIDEEIINKDYDEYCVLKMSNADLAEEDKDLNIIFNHYVSEEEKVIDSVEKIKEKIINNTIPYYFYPRLLENLIRIKSLLNIDYSYIKEKMIINLKKKDSKLYSDYFSYRYLSLDDDEEKEYCSVIGEIEEVIEKKNEEIDFSYKPDDIVDLKDRITKTQLYIENNHMFICRFSVSSLVKMLFQSTSEQIMLFRSMMYHVYGRVNKQYSEKQDIDELKNFKEALINEKEKSGDKLDRIQVFQMEKLILEIGSFLTKLS